MTDNKFQGQDTVNLAPVGNPARCSAAERKRFFGEKRAGCLSSPQVNEFLPAPKKPFARGTPKAKLRGAVLLVLFLPPRKVH